MYLKTFAVMYIAIKNFASKAYPDYFCMASYEIVFLIKAYLIKICNKVDDVMLLMNSNKVKSDHKKKNTKNSRIITTQSKIYIKINKLLRNNIKTIVTSCI